MKNQNKINNAAYLFVSFYFEIEIETNLKRGNMYHVYPPVYMTRKTTIPISQCVEIWKNNNSRLFDRIFSYDYYRILEEEIPNNCQRV